MSHEQAFPTASPASTGGRRSPGVPVVTEVLALASAVLITAPLVAVGVLVTVRRGEIESVVGPAVADSGVVQLINALVGLAGISSVAALITTTWWLQGIRDIARWCDPGHPPRRSSLWVPMGWIVPVVELWFPYQVVADASRGVGSKVTNFWPWWISWLVLMHGTILFGRSTGPWDLETPSDVSRFVVGYQAGAVLLVVALLLWWRVVRAATTAAAAAVRGDTVTP